MGSAFSERIERVCTAFGRQPAFIEPSGGVVTFQDFFDAILRFAERMSQAGVQPGHHVVVDHREPVAFAALKFAIMRLGASPIAVTPETMLQNGPIRVDWSIVSSDGKLTDHPNSLVFDATWAGPAETYTPITPGGGIIHATSGTTGLPKLRRDTEEVFMARINNGLVARGELNGPVLVAHNYGTLIGIKSVATALLQMQLQMPMLWSVEQTLTTLVDCKVTHAFVPPIHLKRLAEVAADACIQTPLLERINVGGGALSASFAQDCERIFGCEIYTDYGSTETDTIACARARDTEATPGLVGRIWPGYNFKFVSEDDTPSSAETGGELFMKPPQNIQTRNYPGDESLADKDGWVSTGDIGYLQENGDLVLVGRKSDLINTGGNKVSPLVVEQTILGMGEVPEVAVFRLPTDTGIDAVGVAVAGAPDLEPKALEERLRSDFNALYEYRVFLRDALPYGETGKVKRDALTKEYSAG